MNTRVLLLGCLFALAVQAQESKRELWMWKDANGVTQYSDRPVPGAKKVELSGVTSPSSAAAPAATPAAAAPATRASAAATVNYQSLEIWQPRERRIVFRRGWHVNVRMRSEPSLASGDRLSLYLDGKLVEGAADILRIHADERGAWRALPGSLDPRRQGQGEDPQRAARVSHEAAVHERAARGRAEPQAAGAANTDAEVELAQVAVFAHAGDAPRGGVTWLPICAPSSVLRAPPRSARCSTAFPRASSGSMPTAPCCTSTSRRRTCSASAATRRRAAPSATC